MNRLLRVKLTPQVSKKSTIEKLKKMLSSGYVKCMPIGTLMM